MRHDLLATRDSSRAARFVGALANRWSLVNVGAGERAASLAAGMGLALLGLTRRGLSGVALAGVATAFFLRGATGHCEGYQILGINRAPRRNARGGVPARTGARVQGTITINATPDTVYSFWRQLGNLPRFFDHLLSVTEESDRRSHWVAKGPLGTTMEWDAIIHNERPHELIAWRSVEGSQVDTAGAVHFAPAPRRGCEVRVSLKYNPPGGVPSVSFARWLGESPEQYLQIDLRRLKQWIEAGEIATTEGQPTGRQPPRPAKGGITS